MPETDVILAEASASALDAVYPWMERDFAGTLMSRGQIERLLDGGAYHLLLAKRAGETAGYALVFLPETPRVIWLDYFATLPPFRGQGVGSRVFERLARWAPAECASGGDRLGALLEVERATSADPRVRSEQARRIAFYERLGARELPVDYQYPAYDGAERMALYFAPAPGVRGLSKEQIGQAITAAFATLHADTPHRDAILRAILPTVRDVSI